MSEYRKFLAALLTAVATAASIGLLPDGYAAWVPVLVVFAGALGVYVVPNSKPTE